MADNELTQAQRELLAAAEAILASQPGDKQPPTSRPDAEGDLVQAMCAAFSQVFLDAGYERPAIDTKPIESEAMTAALHVARQRIAHADDSLWAAVCKVCTVEQINSISGLVIAARAELSAAGERGKA